MFKELLQFDDVQIFNGDNKAEIIEKICELQEIAEKFEMDQKKNNKFEHLAIGIVWIGNSIYGDDHHQELLD